jgi:BirA family transcriptional regulator, biotin operon repressor / biotin---[acetyl-CoA-carboxylase] ligase
MLDEKIIEKYLTSFCKTHLEKIFLLKNITSTNDYLKTAFLDKKKISICLAENQTAGRGRLGKPWFSPKNLNLYLSYGFVNQKGTNVLSGLNVVIAVALFNALSEYDAQNVFKNKLTIKWPNDILWRAQKLAGILIEVEPLSKKENKIIIGIGLNVNMQNQSVAITKPWTSLYNITGQTHDRNKIVALLLNHLTESLDKFAKHGIGDFLPQWQAHDYLYGKEITLKLPNNTKVAGVAMGLDEQGRLLLLRRENGVVEHCVSGEVRIKK